MNKRKNRHKNTYIHKLQEWQDKQYLPGYYLGGNIPPQVSQPGNPKLLGWFWIVQGVFGLLLTIVFFSVFYEDIFQSIRYFIVIFGVFLFFSCVCLLQIIGGIHYLKKAYRKEKLNRITRKIIIIILLCFFIVVFIIILNNTLFVKTIKTTVDIDNIGIYSDGLLIRNEIMTLKLRCSAEEKDLIRGKIFRGESGSITIYYYYGMLTPNKGILIEIE